jgi:hypothetical protein
VVADAKLLRYLPDDAYIARFNPEAVPEVRRLPGVRWVGPYHPAYRLDPSVFPEPFKIRLLAWVSARPLLPAPPAAS